ncbi:MAG TPA: hypothetical protein VKU85_08665, partial [bacterium]|nr:hypothetical protein [bacterium]
MTTLSRRGHRILLGGLALIGLAGCAVPRPAPPEPAPTADPAEREVPDRSDDLPPPDDLPDDPGAEEARLRERVQAATDARARGSHRLALAQWLERADRPESAAVEYALVPGGAAPADRAAAWWGLARLHARDGEERAAARARLQAWELEQDRSKTADEVRRSVEALPTADLQRLEFEARGLAGHEMVMREVGDRRRAVGDEAVVIAMLIPVSGRFEQYGAAFRLGAELALAARNEALPEAVPVRVVVRD